MPLTSEFIYDNNPLDDKELLRSSGATSLSYKVRIEGRQYFMKLLRPELYADLRNRVIFHKEFEIGSSISSDRIVKYEKICEDDNGLYILMEYIYGDSVEELLDSGRNYFTNESNVWKLIMQLLEGLKEFHTRGIAYLDVSPGNIMLTQVGNNVKIIDLGFCFNNAYGHTAGTTRGFTAPEVAGKHLNEIDERSDIYAVGCLMKYIQEKSGAKYSRSFHKIMRRCLNERKEMRFSSTNEMMRAIRNRNLKRNFSLATLLAVLTAMILIPGARQRENEPLGGNQYNIQDTATHSGVTYRILDHESATCEVIGGKGDEWNIYIRSEIDIDGKKYRTTQVAEEAFKDKPIKSVYLPEGIETISNHAFADCDSVISIYLPNSVSEISGAFCGMKNLKSVRIPREMATIGNAAFVLCTSLENVEIPEGVERISLDAFAKCGLKRISLPSTLKALERGVFFDCDSLEEITIPASVKEIGDYIFYECDNLKEVYNHAPTPQPINMIINSKGVKVHVPATSLEAYKRDFSWQKYNIVGDL